MSMHIVQWGLSICCMLQMRHNTQWYAILAVHSRIPPQAEKQIVTMYVIQLNDCIAKAIRDMMSTDRPCPAVVIRDSF